jgi:hypothetical protein
MGQFFFTIFISRNKCGFEAVSEHLIEEKLNNVCAFFVIDVMFCMKMIREQGNCSNVHVTVLKWAEDPFSENSLGFILN